MICIKPTFVFLWDFESPHCKLFCLLQWYDTAVGVLQVLVQLKLIKYKTNTVVTEVDQLSLNVFSMCLCQVASEQITNFREEPPDQLEQ